MLLPNALDEVQLITLRDILTTAGLTKRQVEDVLLLLSFKPRRVQLAFYYRACGETQEWIADKLMVSQQRVSQYFDENLDNVKKYIKYSQGLL